MVAKTPLTLKSRICKSALHSKASLTLSRLQCWSNKRYHCNKSLPFACPMGLADEKPCGLDMAQGMEWVWHLLSSLTYYIEIEGAGSWELLLLPSRSSILRTPSAKSHPGPGEKNPVLCHVDTLRAHILVLNLQGKINLHKRSKRSDPNLPLNSHSLPCPSSFGSGEGLVLLPPNPFTYSREVTLNPPGLNQTSSITVKIGKLNLFLCYYDYTVVFVKIFFQ